MISRYIVFLLLNFCLVTPHCYAQQNNRAKTLYDSAWVYYNSGNYALSLEYVNNALVIKQQAKTDNPPEYVKIYNRLGRVYYELGNLQSAVDSYNKALDNTQNAYYKAIINMNIAIVYTFRGDCSKAIEAYENSLAVLNKIENKNKYIHISEIYHNIGYAYSILDKNNIAKENYLISIRISKEHNTGNMGDTYRNCGLAYEKLDSLELAGKFFKMAIKINTKTFGENHPKTLLAYISLAELYAKTKEYAKAGKLYARVHADLLATVGKKHLYIAYYYKYLGDMHSKIGDYQKALACYQHALVSKITDFNDSSVCKNPSLSTIPDIDLINILKSKAETLEKLSDETARQENLELALKTLELTVSFIEQLRMGYLYEDSKLTLAENEHKIYEDIIRISYTLTVITGKKAYADTAFMYSERGKFAVLRESVNEEAARATASIPDSILAKEKRIREQIGNARLQANPVDKMAQPDENRLALLKEKLFSLNQEREQLVKYLEQNYPAYYKRKYDNRVADISMLQSKLQKKEAVISYVLTDSTLYSFLITRQTKIFTSSHVDSTFYRYLKVYQEFLHSEYEPDYVGYRVAAYELYKVLIKPFEQQTEGKSLVIIPDSKMSLIAFEPLITEPYQKQPFADYAKEPYLILKYPVSYAYSATLYLHSEQQKKSWNPGFLGFAPGYTEARDSLPPMPLGIKNMKEISRLIDGKIYTGDDATEYNLKKEIKNYGIVHFYAHGYEDLKNPQFSRLYLSHKNDTVEDGYLYAYEIDNLDINAELVVLASCYSGSGAINKSEGALSIGRKFLDAGSPSVIISLWTTSYEPTLFELKEFYRLLAMGKRKDEALRLAKLKYLKTANPLEANPRYWASLVLVGNQDALFRGYIVRKLIFPVLLLVSLFIIIIITIKKRAGKKG